MGQIRGQGEGGVGGEEEEGRELHGDRDDGEWRMRLDIGVVRWSLKIQTGLESLR